MTCSLPCELKTGRDTRVRSCETEAGTARQTLTAVLHELGARASCTENRRGAPDVLCGLLVLRQVSIGQWIRLAQHQDRRSMAGTFRVARLA